MNVDFSNVISIVLFGISIITFVSSLITKAQNDGKVLASVEQIQHDIVEIKSTLKDRSIDVENQKIIAESQEQRIFALEKLCDKLEERVLKLEVKN